jgi:hypothetical protein
MGDWRPEKSTVIEEKMDYVPFHDTRYVDNYWNKHTVYFWVIPANVSGSWDWTIPTLSDKVPYGLEIDQNFQELKGKAFHGSASIPVEFKNGKIIGDRLEFTLERKDQGNTGKLHFEGIVKNHDIVGFVRIEGKPGFEQQWQARRDPSTHMPIEK